MGVFEMHLSSGRETASFILGMISVVVWVVAEIPQIITNYRAKSTDGLSITFLVTWIIGDLFNLFGCMLEPATLPTQLYMAVLYTIITVALGSQAIYYTYIYPQSKYKHEQVETPTQVGWVEIEKGSDAEQSHEYDDFGRDGDRSSPIPLPGSLQRISVERELFFQSARSLSQSQTPTARSFLLLKKQPTSPDPIQENLLGSAAATKSEPSLDIKSTLCVVSVLTFLGTINLYKSLDNAVVSNPRQQFVIYVGRRLLQVGGDQFLANGASGSGGIGTFLGWAMALIYLGGRLPQICLNIRRGHAEGLNPFMFLFALIGNATYIASILVSSMDWSTIGPNLPWLVDAGGCVLLDFVILMQFLYFRCQATSDLYKDQTISH